VGGALERRAIAEEDRAGRTRLRARRLQPRLLPVVAEGALEGATIGGPPVDDAERTGDDAVAAAVADVGLDVDAAEFGAHDGAGRTRLQAAGVLAVLADVGGELPRHPLRRVAAPAKLRLALDELDVPPRGVPERQG